MSATGTATISAGSLETASSSATAQIGASAPLSDTQSSETHGWSAEDLLPEKLQASVLYENAYPGVDLLYTTFGYNVKEQIIVRQPQSNYSYSFYLEQDGLTAVLNTDGSVSLNNASGTEVYNIPAPFMEDADGIVSEDVAYTVTSVSGGVTLTVTADANWMNDTARVYPISIDPSLVISVGGQFEDIYSSYLEYGNPNTARGGGDILYFGYSSGYAKDGVNPIRERRLLLHFKTLPQIPAGATVVDAQLSMYMNSYSYTKCTEFGGAIYEVTSDKPDTYDDYEAWIDNVTWNSQPSYDTSNMIDYTMLGLSGVHTYYNWNMTEQVKK